jgi:hypothetical protein
MIKNILPLCCLGFCIPSFAATPSSSFTPFIPKNWKIIETVTGDLNRDGLNDSVLVIEDNNPENVIANAGLGSDRLNLNPRKLLVLFQTAQGYQLITENDSLPTENDEESPCLADPMEDGGISIHKGILKINLHYWLSCGSWYVTNNSFSFRYQNNAMRLIGFDQNEFHRASGDQSSRSINFSTGKVKTTTGENEFAESTQPVQVKWSKLQQTYNLKLEQIDFNEPPEFK